MNFEKVSTIQHDLHGFFEKFMAFSSTESMEQSALYQELKPQILKLLHSYTLESTDQAPAAEPYYRAVAWNVERGICYDEIIYFLKNHSVMAKADILLITETDLGMARSGNRNIAEDIARELGMNYFFVPSYLNLAKGAGTENEASGDNTIGIHGNAILSRYPIHNPRIVSFPNPHDKMVGREKRLGQQRALIATVDLAGKPVRVGCFHVNVRSTQKQRKEEVERVVQAIAEEGNMPALIGGDWNTSTYDSHNAASAIIGFWVRVCMGTHNMIRNHYPHPERFFEKKLFQMLEKNGFDYRTCNEIGATTNHYRVESIKQFKNLREWIPDWCFRFIEWSLKEHEGKCSFKLDWMAQRGLTILKDNEVSSSLKGSSVAPKVIGNLIHNGREASDHDAISFDFKLA